MTLDTPLARALSSSVDKTTACDVIAEEVDAGLVTEWSGPFQSLCDLLLQRPHAQRKYFRTADA
jgi:hypothetical protein